MQRPRREQTLSASSSLNMLEAQTNSTTTLDNVHIHDSDLTKTLFARPSSSSSMSMSMSMPNKNNNSSLIDKYKEDMRQRRITAGGTSRHVIDKLQGIYLSKKFSSYIPISQDESSSSSSSSSSPSSDINGSGNGNNAHHPSGRIPLCKGIDRVVNGTKPAADVVIVCGMKPVRYLWYMLSGGTYFRIQNFIRVYVMVHDDVFVYVHTCWCWCLLHVHDYDRFPFFDAWTCSLHFISMRL